MTIAKPGASAVVVLSVDGAEVARTEVARTVPVAFTASETFDVGTNLGSPVSLTIRWKGAGAARIASLSLPVCGLVGDILGELLRQVAGGVLPADILYGVAEAQGFTATLSASQTGSVTWQARAGYFDTF